MGWFNILQIVFWAVVGLLFYTYVGYPVLVYLLSRLRPQKVSKGETEPNVTILITAYNEEQDIEAKLENTLALEYPKDKLQILVASDGSTDGTDDIVKRFADRGIELCRVDGRKGKTHTQNVAVESARGEIIVFSDATTDYSPDVLRRLLPNFVDESIGCVAGRLIYRDKDSTDVGAGAKGYWSYETFLKENESLACSLIGVSGCLYAVRKTAYRPMYPEACSDFLIATVVYGQGLRTIYEPAAVCIEETNKSVDRELQMRVRVIAQTFTDLWRNRRMMNPFVSGFYAVQLFSHKLLRYSVPIFLLITFFSAGFLSIKHLFYEIVFVAQAAFYGFALLAWLLEKSGRKVGLFALPLYFVMANVASAMGFLKFLSGKRYSSWEPIR